MTENIQPNGGEPTKEELVEMMVSIRAEERQMKKEIEKELFTIDKIL